MYDVRRASVYQASTKLGSVVLHHELVFPEAWSSEQDSGISEVTSRFNWFSVMCCPGACCTQYKITRHEMTTCWLLHLIPLPQYVGPVIIIIIIVFLLSPSCSSLSINTEKAEHLGPSRLLPLLHQYQFYFFLFLIIIKYRWSRPFPFLFPFVFFTWTCLSWIWGPLCPQPPSSFFIAMALIPFCLFVLGK